MVVVVANRAVEMRDAAGMDFFGVISRMVGNVRWYLNRRKVQQRLEALDDRLLEDIGLNRADISSYVWGR
jgi:uncharacterized protein YjiS (DUF1127 family)